MTTRSHPKWQIWAMVAVAIGIAVTLAATFYDVFLT